MKKFLGILLVTTIFIATAAFAVMFYDDSNPNPSGCKTCIYKSIIDRE